MPHVSIVDLLHALDNERHALEEFRKQYQYAPRVSLVLGELDVLRHALQQNETIHKLTGQAQLRLEEVAQVWEGCSTWLQERSESVASHGAAQGQSERRQLDDTLLRRQERLHAYSLCLKEFNLTAVLYCAFASDAGLNLSSAEHHGLILDGEEIARVIRELQRLQRKYGHLRASYATAAIPSQKAEAVETDCSNQIKRLVRLCGLREHPSSGQTLADAVADSAGYYEDAMAKVQRIGRIEGDDLTSTHLHTLIRGEATILLENSSRQAAGFIMYPHRCCWLTGPLIDLLGSTGMVILEQCFTNPLPVRIPWRHVLLHKKPTVAFMRQDRQGFELVSYDQHSGPIAGDCQYEFAEGSGLYVAFQTELRQKRFMEEFKTSYIKLSNGEQLQDQYIKLWRDPHHYWDTSVTLPVIIDGDVRHMELRASFTAVIATRSNIIVLEAVRLRREGDGEVVEAASRSPRRNSLLHISSWRRHDHERQQPRDVVHIKLEDSRARDAFVRLFTTEAPPPRSPSPPPFNLPSPMTRTDSDLHQGFGSVSRTTTQPSSVFTPVDTPTSSHNVPSTTTIPSSPPSLRLPPPHPKQPLSPLTDLNIETWTAQLVQSTVRSVPEYWQPGAWPSSGHPGAFFKDTTGSSFVYRRLRTEREIRLLRVRPASKGPIVCDIEHYALDSVPTYEALSYCWGEHGERNTIQIGGREFQISHHLWEGLCRLRPQDASKDQARMLWIDAISINQADVKEKNHQIRLMPEVYRRAYRTVIWLGELGLSGETCRRAFRSSEEREDMPPTLCSRPGKSAVLHRKGNLSDKLKEILHPRHRELEQTGGGDFWWKRLWCVQEYAFSSLRPSVYIGPHAISWAHFFSLFDETNSPLLLFSTLRTPEEHALYDLLIRTGSFHCGDPRDRIYSLLGMAPLAAKTIDPDYGTSALRVYEEACRYLIKEADTLDVLIDRRVDRFLWGRDQLPAVMPTWMPDFTSLFSLSTVNRINDYGSGYKAPDFRISVRHGDDYPVDHSYDVPRVLSIKAVRFDKIRARTTEANIPDYEHSPQHHLIYNSRLQRGDLTNKVLEVLNWNYPTRTAHDLDPAAWIGLMILDYLFEDKRSAIDEVERRSQQPGRDIATTYRRQRDEDVKHAQFYNAKEDVTYARSRWKAKIEHAEQGVINQPPRLQPALAAAAASGDHRVMTDFLIARDFENLFAYARKAQQRYYFTSNNFDAPMRSDVLEQSSLAEVKRLPTQYDVQEEPEFHEYSAKSRKRDFFRTSSGFLGLGPETIEIDDIVIVPFGASRPFILRECDGPGETYQFIGEAMIPALLSEETWVEQQQEAARFYNLV